jgi:phage gp29-like protein
MRSLINKQASRNHSLNFVQTDPKRIFAFKRSNQSLEPASTNTQSLVKIGMNLSHQNVIEKLKLSRHQQDESVLGSTLAALNNQLSQNKESIANVVTQIIDTNSVTSDNQNGFQMSLLQECQNPMEALSKLTMFATG